MHTTRATLALAALTSLTALAGAQVAAPAPQPNSAALLIHREGLDARVAFVSAPDRRAPIIDATGQPITSPQAFLAQRAALFGVADPANQLSLTRRETDPIGWTTTSYQQMKRGVPVFSGILKVHQNTRGEVVVANGAIRPIPEKLNVTPTLTPAQAADAARRAGAMPQATVQSSRLVVVDPGWYGDRSRGVHLAYEIHLADNAASYRQAFFIDAHNAEILDSWSLVENFLYREIHDGLGGSSLPGPVVRAEGDPATGDFDTDAAYDYYADVYNYYARAFNRDSIDGAGLVMIATTHSTAPGCPNAYWDGYQMVFCDGTVTDDIIGHELTHGVTQYSANLIYQNQPGQLNESFSDVFGELIDLFNGDAAFAGTPGGTPWGASPTGPGLDTPNNLRTTCSYPPSLTDGVRWLLGEDATAFGGAIRDMWNPTCYGQPDTASSPSMGCSAFDSGGVHGGSGVPNHAFALATDGGTFNAINIAGIGPIKAGAVWYRALTTYLTPGSDFEDAYWALNQAAHDLIGTNPNDPRTGAPSASTFTTADATSIDDALRAVELNTVGLCGGEMDPLSYDPAPDCSPMTTLFADDFESGAPGWTTGNATSGVAYDWSLSAGPLPHARNGHAFFIANTPATETGDESGTHWLDSPTINLPGALAFPVLRFDHWIECEPRWDGGAVYVSVDNGPFTKLPAEDFFFNPYNDILFGSAQGNANPRAAQPAFSGLGANWGTSMAFLGNVVPANASTLRVRFEFSKDTCCGNIGWYVDDVSVFDCTSEPDCNNNGVPDAIEKTLASADNLVWNKKPALGTIFTSDADPDNGGYQIIATRTRTLMTKTIEKVRVWGVYSPNDNPPAADFTLRIYAPNPSSGNPGALEYAEDHVAATRTPDGTRNGLTLYRIELTPSSPPTLAHGEHWVELRDNTAGSADSFAWLCSDYDVGYYSLVYSNDAPPVTNWYNTNINPSMSLQLVAAPPTLPCIGDLNGDCAANVFDFGTFASQFGATGVTPYSGADLDGDGEVTVFDFGIFATSFGCTP